MRPAEHLTPEQIRARVDEMAPRTNEGHPSYIADIDGPGRFRPTGDIAAISVGKLTTDVITADVVISLDPHRTALQVPDGFVPGDDAPSSFADVRARAIERLGRKLNQLDVQAAAINQLAVASVAYRQERLALSRTIRWSVGYGIPLAEVVSTTGLPEALILELLDEVD